MTASAGTARTVSVELAMPVNPLALAVILVVSAAVKVVIRIVVDCPAAKLTAVV